MSNKVPIFFVFIVGLALLNVFLGAIYSITGNDINAWGHFIVALVLAFISYIVYEIELIKAKLDEIRKFLEEVDSYES